MNYKRVKKFYALWVLLITVPSCSGEQVQWEKYSSDQVLILNPKDSEDQQSTARMTIEVVDVISPLELQKMIREDICGALPPNQWAQDNQEKFFKDMQDMYDELSQGDFGWEENPRELFQEYRIGPVDSLPGLFALHQFWSAYEGGAHPNHSESYFLYSKASAQRITPEDILLKDQEDQISWLLTKALGEYFRDSELGDVADLLLVDAIPFPEDVLPTTQGLKVQWDPYEITPYGLGSPEVLIPWKDLKGVLNPKFLKFLPDKP